ncbi:MAG: PD-(D/E)XK nuclease family protein, partial [Acidobacteria bacterium]|nr:PD-(D/E)XK nuclease family protein [Acidobacteriota bacterium]
GPLRAALAARSVWVYGFADATGVATDLLEALLERYDGRLYLDQPSDPVAPHVPDAGIVFTRRFRERLETRARVVEAAAVEPVAAPQIDLFRALGTDGEVREVGRRARDLVDQGVKPEAISIVARQIAPYARALRLQFASLGLPFSCYGAPGAKDRLGRRAEALSDLLQRRGEISIERWLELVDRRFGGRSHADLRTGFAALGIGRLAAAAALAEDSYRLDHDLALPVRHGFSQVEDATGAARGLYLRRRKVPAEALGAAVEAAAKLTSHFAAWEEASHLEAHGQAFDALLSEHLLWGNDKPEGALRLQGAAVWEALPPDYQLTLGEFVEGVAPRLRDFGGTALGGRGGGVQVLDVVEARGRTSEHLFVMGLNRGLFPRVVREDPLLPDSLRGVISRQGFGVLPDLPDKRSGFDEERFLFAQLLASSPRVTLSWQDTDDDQLPLAPSPLLERLRWASGRADWKSPVLARPVTAQLEAVPRSPLENGIAIALEGPRSRLAKVLPHLIPHDGRERSLVARARTAILDEIDPLSGSPGASIRLELGPYFGFVGSSRAGGPRREQRLYVTTLERLSGCPWQVFLERILRLEPVPDPLAALPGVTPLLIGALVHEVLEEIVRRGLTDDVSDLAQARQRIPQAIPWPDPKELEAIIYRCAEALCRQEGIAIGGFARVLGRAVAPFLDRARQLDWTSEAGLHVLGVELEGKLDIPDPSGAQRAIHFRADRLDLGDHGLILTDYKTGRRTVSSAKQPRSRRKHLLQSVARGERLQAVAYALAAGQAGDSGRYLFLHPETENDRGVRDVRIGADDAELESAFTTAAGAALATWDAGSFFPRLVQPDRDEEPKRCQYCAVRDACLRGDSGARRRLREWMEKRQQRFLARSELSPAELILLTSWRLPAVEGK